MTFPLGGSFLISCVTAGVGPGCQALEVTVGYLACAAKATEPTIMVEGSV